jgi:hypothetical protein
MAQSARDDRISRRSWLLLAGLGIGVSRLRAAPALAVSFDGDNLRVATPDLHFLVGKPLERLKDAATVTYLSQLTIFSDAYGTVLKRSPIERLVVSYDLWQEKFSVTIPGGGRRSIFNVSAQQAESWCLDNLAISALGLPSDRPFWMQFDLRTNYRRDLGSVVGDNGVTLSGLIDLFSRKQGVGDISWSRNDGPFRLLDLPRTPSGRGKIG